jgi:hypothetical protein
VSAGNLAEGAARVFLAHLRSARQPTNLLPDSYVSSAIDMLPVLHELTADGELPQTVDGQPFRVAAALLLN